MSSVAAGEVVPMPILPLDWNRAELASWAVGLFPIHSGTKPTVWPGDAVWTFNSVNGASGAFGPAVAATEELETLGDCPVAVWVSGLARTNAEGGKPPMVEASAAFNA